jgi:NDP-sugar pyrophosphorylase family protein
MANDSLNVLILAAGLGTRLRPLTNDVPKPLVPVVDASILDLQARKARSIENVRLHANAHYLAEQVVAAGKTLGFEKVWVEPEILGTAGPLRRIYAEGYRGGLLVMNGDAYCDFDLKKFVQNAREMAQKPNGAQVALLAVDFPKVNTFRVGADGRLAGVVGRFGSEEGAPATFSGVSWYSDEALSRIRDGEFDIREFWKQEMAAGRAPFVDMNQLHATWIDMGSPEGLMSAVEARLKELGRNPGESVVETGVEIPAGVTLKHSVIYAGAEIAAGETIENEIRGKGFRWSVACHLEQKVDGADKVCHPEQKVDGSDKMCHPERRTEGS